MRLLKNPWVLSVLAIALVGLVAYLFVQSRDVAPEPEATPVVQQETIGTSVEGRSIEAYTYGSGSTRLLFVGGIHGGYEWNSVSLAYQFMDYLEANSDEVPANLSVTVIPSANPDGVYAVVGKEGRFTVADVTDDEDALASARFNANDVDLNRNFDCKWAPESSWRGATVSAGTSAFSEPEAQAIRDFVDAHDPVAVVFWHSAAGAVYASECKDGILPATLTLMDTYANAADYAAVETFDAYPITGDAEGWLASRGIPAITVELSSHETLEWQQNLRGIMSVLQQYATE